MSGLSVKVVLQDIKKIETEALVVGFFEDVRPLKGLAGQLDWLMCGSLSDILLQNKLRGSLGDVALFTSKGKVPAKKIFLVGLGPKAGFTVSTLRTAAATAAASVSGAGVLNAALEYVKPADAPHASSMQAVQEGLAEGAGSRALTVSVIAPDAAVYAACSQLAAAKTV